jgi:ribonuclease PH
MRNDERQRDQLRPVKLTRDVSMHAEGSVLVETGKTQVFCTASVENNIPKWLMGSGKGWVTAEYSMLPRATSNRNKRDRVANSGRTQEISRLIGRSLRAVMNMHALGEKQITVDCDVIQADGGTRTASITGGFVALCLALKKMHDRKDIRKIPLTDYIAATSVGIFKNEPLLDLCYEEDMAADTDANFVFTGSNLLVEVQATAEHDPFQISTLNAMIEMAQKGCQELFIEQRKIIGDFFPRPTD